MSFFKIPLARPLTIFQGAVDTHDVSGDVNRYQAIVRSFIGAAAPAQDRPSSSKHFDA